VINAGGPFSDEVRALSDAGAPKMIMASSGVHVSLPDYYSPDHLGMIVPKTKARAPSCLTLNQPFPYPNPTKSTRRTATWACRGHVVPNSTARALPAAARRVACAAGRLGQPCACRRGLRRLP
jgi:hypothetical protein